MEDALLARRVGRDSVLIAVGGGVVSDIVGFTAGTYLRGIPYVNIPTTLVGMVDAALGGKTAVNTPRGKNLVGVLHAPAGVCIALEALGTLPESEFRSGLGECLKHGAIADREYFEWLSGLDVRTLMLEQLPLRKLVETSVRIKMSVVDSDPAERSGRRNVLNAGHTVAHALEHLSRFQIGHGAAVAAGLCWEAAVAVAQGYMPREDFRRLVDCVRCIGFDDRREDYPADRVFEAAGWDKKNRGGTVNYVPLGAIGRPALPAPHTDELTLSALERGLGFLKEL
jgi:3-dehydroquinate synthase